MQAAALAVCQYLAVESAHPSSPLFEESSSSEATTPVTIQHVRPPKQKKQKTSPVPPLPIVLQLMEMGFPRKNIEFALKSLSGTTGNASGVPGIILCWNADLCYHYRSWNFWVLTVLIYCWRIIVHLPYIRCWVSSGLAAGPSRHSHHGGVRCRNSIRWILWWGGTGGTGGGRADIPCGTLQSILFLPVPAT